jgi:hypothetical protein
VVIVIEGISPSRALRATPTRANTFTNLQCSPGHATILLGVCSNPLFDIKDDFVEWSQVGRNMGDSKRPKALSVLRLSWRNVCRIIFSTYKHGMTRQMSSLSAGVGKPKKVINPQSHRFSHGKIQKVTSMHFKTIFLIRVARQFF